MPLARFTFNEGVFTETRINALSNAIQGALREVLKVPEDDLFQIFNELPKSRFRHTPSFVGMTYTDEFICLEVTILAGRSREVRLALLKEINKRCVQEADLKPDDLFINVYEIAGENASFGRGEAQRAFISAGV